MTRDLGEADPAEGTGRRVRPRPMLREALKTMFAEASRYVRFYSMYTISLAAALLFTSGCGPAAEEEGPAPALVSVAVEQQAASGGGTPPQPMPPLRSAWVILGTDTVVAEVARTTAEHEQGLMYREELPDGTGMLFIFQNEQVRSFWMSNTFVALDVAWLDASLRVVEIQQMEPETTDLHSSDHPAMFALEVPQGWFTARGVVVGATAELVLGPL